MHYLLIFYCRSGLVSDQSQVIHEENESDGESGDAEHSSSAGVGGEEEKGEGDKQRRRAEVQRSVSEGGARHSPSPQPDLLMPHSEDAGRWSHNGRANQRE